MKKQMLKKLMAVTLTVAMAVSVLTACGNDGQQVSSDESTSVVNTAETGSEAGTESDAAAEDDFEHDPVLNELGAVPFCKEEVTITVGLRQNVNVENYKENYYTQLLEEEAGVNLEFVLFPSGDEGTQKLRMMIAGNEELPDIIMWGQNEVQVQQWGEEGYIVPLEDYFEHSSYYAAEGYARVLEESNLDILDFITGADGHIWTFPQYFESTTNPTNNRTWVYGPWLDKLGIDPPTTTEEFYEMLVAFKTQDPNGNGKADEIPFLGSDITKTGKTGAHAWEYVMNAFQSTCTRGQATRFLVSTDGQLSVSYNTDGWKEGVKYLAKLVQEGLFDPISFTQDEATFKQIVNTSGDPMVGCFTYISTSFIGNEHPTKNEWILLDPLTGPDGVCSTSYMPDLPTNFAYITADCEHPEVAFRILDLMCKEEMTITARWGKQGENWDYVEDLKDDPKFASYDFSNTFAGYPALFYEYNSIWSQPNSTHWMNQQVCFRTAEVAAGWYAASLQKPEEGEYGNANWQLALHLANYEAAAPEETVTKIKFATTELQEEYNSLQGELNKYVYEMLAFWCTGVSDVEADWDNYLKNIDNLGLERMLEIAQQGWN